MRLHTVLVLILAVAPAISRAKDTASIFAGINTRSACVENLKGLGSASIIFDAPTTDGDAENPGPHGEWSWDAQLVTESGQIVRVQLHCALSSPMQQSKEFSGPRQSIVSELVRH